jgi:hypothetical protein
MLMVQSIDDLPRGIVPKRREPNGRKQRPSTRAGQRQSAKAKARARVDEIRGVVLDQPHRRGSDEWGRVNAIGRLILDKRVWHRDFRDDNRHLLLLEAAKRYQQAHQRWLWAEHRKKTILAEREGLEGPPRLSPRPIAPSSTRMHVATYVPELCPRTGKPLEMVETAPAPRTFLSGDDEMEALDATLRAFADVQRAIKDSVPTRLEDEQIKTALRLAILDDPGEDWAAPFIVTFYAGYGLAAVARFYGIA